MQRVRYCGSKRPLIAAAAALILPVSVFSFGPRLWAAGGSNSVSHPLPIGVAAPVPPALVRSTNEALAEYYRVARSLEAGREEEAVAFLESAIARPLVITEFSGSGPAPGDISGPGLVIQVARRIKDRVLLLSRAHGESELARQEQEEWLRRARRISSQILSTDVPTLDALSAARTIDTQIGKAEEQVLKNVGKTADAARVAEREKVLTAFYRDQIMRELVAASEWRQRMEFAALQAQQTGGNGGAQKLEQVRREIRLQDSKLAEALMREYSAKRGALLSAGMS